MAKIIMRKIYGRKLKVSSVKHGHCFNSTYLPLSFYLELKNEKKIITLIAILMAVSPFQYYLQLNV